MNRTLAIGLLLATLSASPRAWAARKSKTGHAAAHRLARRHPIAHKRVAVHKFTGPKPAPLFQKDLDAALNHGRLAGGHIEVQLSGRIIHLNGWVKGAENRGRATEQARLVARHDHWKNIHVYNQLRVK